MKPTISMTASDKKEFLSEQLYFIKPKSNVNSMIIIKVTHCFKVTLADGFGDLTFPISKYSSILFAWIKYCGTSG